jgi:small-conductance mechanosensitive channel
MPAGEEIMTIATGLGSFGFSVMLAAGAVAQSPPPTATEATRPSPPPMSPHVDRGAPVELDGETLYYVHSFMGILSPEDRASAANRKIKLLADDPFYSPELFSTQDVDGATRILYGNSVVGLVTSEDVAAVGEPSAKIAAERISAITTAIAQHRHRQLPRARVQATVGIIVATVALVLLLLGIRRGYRKLATMVRESRPDAREKALAARMGMQPERVITLELRLVVLLRVVITILVLAIYLQIAFSFLPLTRGYALTVLNYLLEPIQTLWSGFLREVGNLFTILVLVVLTRYALKGLRWLLYEASEGRVTVPGIAQEWGVPLYKILRIIIIALSAVMIYPYVPGSDTEAFKGLSLFAGALFTLGASGTIGNFIGGLIAIFVGAFRIGDVVKIGDVLGVVAETTMTLTRIRTPLNTIVSVPNISILNGQLINYSIMARTDGVILTTGVTIGYDAPWRTVHGLLLEAAARTSRIEKTPAPFVLQTSLDDFYVSYQLHAYTREPQFMHFIYGELHANIQDAFNAGRVEIMSPHYRSLRDGNTVTIPENQRAQGYAAPRFSVSVERTGD